MAFGVLADDRPLYEKGLELYKVRQEGGRGGREEGGCVRRGREGGPPLCEKGLELYKVR